MHAYDDSRFKMLARTMSGVYDFMVPISSSITTLGVLKGTFAAGKQILLPPWHVFALPSIVDYDKMAKNSKNQDSSGVPT